MCAPCVPENDELVERYIHHGRVVSVLKELRGKHKSHCLCFICLRFNPDTPENCEIAQATFENCLRFGTTTPMYECPKFSVIAGHGKVRRK
jgi:hypothetical protein